jgi:hypothetical protein
MFSVRLRCSSFWGITTIAYRLPLLEMFASTRPIGTSSFGKSRSTVSPSCFRRCSIYSAYSLLTGHFSLLTSHNHFPPSKRIKCTKLQHSLNSTRTPSLSIALFRWNSWGARFLVWSAAFASMITICVCLADRWLMNTLQNVSKEDSFV